MITAKQLKTFKNINEPPSPMKIWRYILSIHMLEFSVSFDFLYCFFLFLLPPHHFSATQQTPGEPHPYPVGNLQCWDGEGDPSAMGGGDKKQRSQSADYDPEHQEQPPGQIPQLQPRRKPFRKEAYWWQATSPPPPPAENDHCRASFPHTSVHLICCTAVFKIPAEQLYYFC